MLTQLLYGELFKIIENRKYWSKIRSVDDGMEGWVTKQQFLPIDKSQFSAIEENENPKYASDLVGYATANDQALIPVLLGSSVSNAPLMSQSFEGTCLNGARLKSNIVPTAMYYLHAPFLWGGKTPFGVDDAGLSQMVYKINGYRLPRRASEQAMVGESLSFIEESEPGDLAFFDDKEGNIDHVGIIMKDNFIIHSHGKVRIDRIDHTGIFNTDEGLYSHPLRVIKKIV
jgi:cell wall-associated NlpC family hydrolase